MLLDGIVHSSMSARLFLVAIHFSLLALTCAFEECKYFELKPNVSLYADGCKRGAGNSTDRLGTFADIVNDNPLLKSVELHQISIEKIPTETCRLKNLKKLILESNGIKQLPKGCFVHLTNLETLSITYNDIALFPSSEISGLNKLTTLILHNNKIETVEESALSNTSDLVALKSVVLFTNRLTSTGPWPLIRGTSTNGFLADLSNNEITSFTNDVGWKFRCNLIDRSSLNFTFSIRSNSVRHLMDLVDAYFGDIANFWCIFGGRAHTDVSLILEENMMWCDCRDYNIKKIMLQFSRVHLLNSARCDGPKELRNQRYLVVPLEQMVCDHTGTASCIDGCRCFFRPHGMQFVVDCSLKRDESTSTKMLKLPQSLCPLSTFSNSSKIKYNISLSGNDIAILERRDYFRQTKVLDLSFVRLNKVDDDALEYLRDVEVLNLGGNLLETLPASAASVQFSSREINLNGNRWKCDCASLWFKGWLMAMRSVVKNYDSIHCATPEWLVGKMIVKVENHEFCQDPRIQQGRQIALASSISIISVVVLVVAFLLLMKKFKVQLHAYLNIHPFDRDECHGENMVYDAFISSAFNDRKFAIELVQFLETRGYRVCYHEKDFIGGQTIVENICQAIASSKRVVCYLTKSFVESHYCMYEFQSALHLNIQTKQRRLIALLDDSLEIKPFLVPDDVYQFLKSHTYVEIKPNNNWKGQLLYSLAVQKLGNVNTHSEMIPIGGDTINRSLNA